ncbi:MAG: hypothetical protein HY033_01135 [Ignavibacteriae bacterium]|nr:hypothetical protein [Ignavibacteria bacterium]MBI3363493.1 hypothetical protein [Ignavibacteriota bacterium]
MSLKAFHIFFISVSILLALGFAGWMIQEYAHDGKILTLAGALTSVVVGVALAIYGFRFLRKLRHVSYL